ncbi:MAG: hypothetical protein K2Y27_08490 [Xanthobacteraceae bacterium]|nr:hypothetical protein [Xanthobacteraceae bacterium]
MIRKFVLAAAAVAALGTASLAASTPAAAHFWHKGWHHHHHHHGFHWRGGYRVYGVGYDSCLRRRWVVNRFGEVVLRVVNVCY